MPPGVQLLILKLRILKLFLITGTVNGRVLKTGNVLSNSFVLDLFKVMKV